MNEILNPLENLKAVMADEQAKEEAVRSAGGGGVAHFLKVPGLDEGEGAFDSSDLSEEDLTAYNLAKSGNMTIEEFRSYIKSITDEHSKAEAENNPELRKITHSRYLFAQYVANTSKFK